MKAAVPAGTILGAALGLALGGAHTFVYARGASYLSNDPRTRVNFQIMQAQYDGWVHSSHRTAAVCNDCHTPAGLLAKYQVKARNGFWHSRYFTTGHHPDPIRIREPNRRVTEGAFRKCHADTVQAIEGVGHAAAPANQATCVRCHREVGHLH